MFSDFETVSSTLSVVDSSITGVTFSEVLKLLFVVIRCSLQRDVRMQGVDCRESSVAFVVIGQM